MWSVSLMAMREEGLTSFACTKGIQESYSRHNVSVIRVLLQRNPKTSGDAAVNIHFAPESMGWLVDSGCVNWALGVTYVPMVGCGVSVVLLILAGLSHVGGLS